LKKLFKKACVLSFLIEKTFFVTKLSVMNQSDRNYD